MLPWSRKCSIRLSKLGKTQLKIANSQGSLPCAQVDPPKGMIHSKALKKKKSRHAIKTTKIMLW